MDADPTADAVDPNAEQTAEPVAIDGGEPAPEPTPDTGGADEAAGQPPPEVPDDEAGVPPGAVTAEALMAVTGVRHVLVDKPKRILVSDKERAEMLPREIRRSVRRFLDESNAAQKIPRQRPFDYQWALQHITEAASRMTSETDPRGHADLIAMFKPEDGLLAAEYATFAKKIVEYLHGLLPIRVEPGMATSVNVDPSDTEIARFRRAYDVANDPMIVMRDLELGILVADQIQHLQACYPTGYQLMKAALAEGMADSMARKKSWRLGYRKDRLVQVLFATSTFSAALGKDLQASFAAQDKMKNDQGPAPAKSQSKAAQNVQTSTSKVADGGAA